MSYTFYFIFSYPFVHFLIYGVSINKFLQGCVIIITMLMNLDIFGKAMQKVIIMLPMSQLGLAKCVICWLLYNMVYR
jgi:hypothetical protein